MGRGRRWLLVPALVVAVLVQVFAAWAPFAFDPPRRVTNGASLVGGVLTLDGHHRVRSPGPVDWPTGDGPVVRGSVVQVDVEVRPARRQHGPARVLAVSRSTQDALLVVGQHGGDLVVRVRREGADRSGQPGLRVRDVLAADRWTAVRVEVRADSVEVWVDGDPVAGEAHPVPPVSTWDGGHRLALGDEPNGGRSWDGQIRRAVATVDDRAVDLLTPGVLEAPASYWYWPPRGWEQVTPRAWQDVTVDVLHLLLFVPVGALLGALWPGVGARRLAAAVLAGAVLLTLSKVAFDGRHPSVADPLWQCAGAVLGLWLVRRSWSRRPGAGDRS